MKSEIIWAICYVSIIFIFTLYLVYKMIINSTSLCGRQTDESWQLDTNSPVRDISTWDSFQVESPYGTSMQQSTTYDGQNARANHCPTSKPYHLSSVSVQNNAGILYVENDTPQPNAGADTSSPTNINPFGIAVRTTPPVNDVEQSHAVTPISLTSNFKTSSTQPVHVTIEDEVTTDEIEQPARPPSALRVQEGEFAFCNMAAAHAEMSISWQSTTAASPPPLENGKTSKLYPRKSSRLRLSRLGSNISNRSRGKSSTGNDPIARSPQQESALQLLHAGDTTVFTPTMSAQRASLDNIVTQHSTDGSTPLQIETFAV